MDYSYRKSPAKNRAKADVECKMQSACVLTDTTSQTYLSEI